jgi:hypothetical protein
MVIEDAGDAVIASALSSTLGIDMAAIQATHRAPVTVAIPAALPEPAPLEIEPEPPKRRAARPVAATPKAEGEGDTIPARIIAALQKKRMSSTELAAALELDVKQIYAPCSLLKAKGLIFSKNDDETDAVRRYQFVK